MTGQSLYYMGEAEHEAQDSGDLRRRRRRPSQLRLEVVTKRWPTHHRRRWQEHRQRSPVNRHVHGRRPRDDVPDDNSEHPDPELQNRCITLRVNESSDQTAEIHNRQRVNLPARVRRNAIRMKSGRLHQKRAAFIGIASGHHALGRSDSRSAMIKPECGVTTPSILSLIASITLLHQHQRKVIDLGSGQDRD